MATQKTIDESLFNASNMRDITIKVNDLDKISSFAKCKEQIKLATKQGKFNTYCYDLLDNHTEFLKSRGFTVEDRINKVHIYGIKISW
jgi:hypothetical protein